MARTLAFFASRRDAAAEKEAREVLSWLVDTARDGGLDSIGVIGLSDYDEAVPTGFRAGDMMEAAKCVVALDCAADGLSESMRGYYAEASGWVDAVADHGENYVRFLVSALRAGLAERNVRSRAVFAADPAAPLLPYPALGKLAGVGEPTALLYLDAVLPTTGEDED